MRIMEFDSEYKDQLIDFIIGIQRKEFSLAINIEDQPDLLDIQKNYVETGGQFWLALDDESLIMGCLGLIRLEGNKSALKKMFVKEEYRDKKIGKQLLEEVFSFCQQVGIEEIYLGTTDKFKNAQYFYAKNGFKRIEKNEMPLDFPLLTVDNLFYKARLD